MKMKLILVGINFIFLFSGCSSGFLRYDGAKSIAKNSDFEKKVKIKSEEPAETEAPATVEKATPQNKVVPKVAANAYAKAKAKLKPLKVTKTKSLESPMAPVSVKRQPELEDSGGFDGASRRPKVNPFRVGETVTHAVRYFATQAGTLTFKVKPFVDVNNRKSYNFLTDIKTVGLFSNFYSVDDQVETYVDYEDLVPHVFKLHIKESAQLKEAQSYFDHKTLKATYWEHKYTEKNGNEEKKQEWNILAFSQNAFSGIFYMRIFAWELGKEYEFRVSDDEKNVVFKAAAQSKEKLSTDAGEFDAIKIKAKVVSRGALTTAEDIYFWISDDDHKYILRIEAKIKIGTLVSEVISIKPGSKEQ